MSVKVLDPLNALNKNQDKTKQDSHLRVKAHSHRMWVKDASDCEDRRLIANEKLVKENRDLDKHLFTRPLSFNVSITGLLHVT